MWKQHTSITCVSCKIENLSTRTHTHTHTHTGSKWNHRLNSANKKLSATNLQAAAAAVQQQRQTAMSPLWHTVLPHNKLSCCMRFVNVTLSRIRDIVGIHTYYARDMHRGSQLVLRASWVSSATSCIKQNQQRMQQSQGTQLLNTLHPVSCSRET